MPSKSPKLNINKPLGSETVSRSAFNTIIDQIDEGAASQLQADQPFYLKSAEYNAESGNIECVFGHGIAEVFNVSTKVLVQKVADTDFNISSPSINTTYYIYLGYDGNFTSNTTGVTPAGSVLLWTIATGGVLSTLTPTDCREQISGAGELLAAHLAEHAYLQEDEPVDVNPMTLWFAIGSEVNFSEGGVVVENAEVSPTPPSEENLWFSIIE